MTEIPLRLGRLEVPGFIVQRSGIRWLYEDGHLCRPGEVIGYCNVGLAATDRSSPAPRPFADEEHDFQIAFAPRCEGRLRISPSTSRGGYIDQQHFHYRWTPDFVVGHLILPPGETSPIAGAEEDLRLLMLTGRRITAIAEDRSGLGSGWHDRRRAWWGDGDGPVGTLLSLGICEQLGIIRGDRYAFLEWFEAAPGPAQIIHMSDEALVPCAAILVEQLHRTDAQRQEIADDIARSFAGGTITPSPPDWMFAGALLSALLGSPLSERHDTMTRRGLQRSGLPESVLLSVHAELPVILRHRRLGYHISSHGFRIAQAGGAVLAWLRGNFEIVKRTPDDIRRDYRLLIDAIRSYSTMNILILNAMSTSHNDNIYNYAPFDRPMGDTLATVRTKESNLMLHDLARERDISIVDVDLIGADLGAQHLPDGIHQSGLMQAEIRSEILNILRERGAAGFGARDLR